MKIQTNNQTIPMDFNDGLEANSFTQRKIALSFVDSKKLPLHRWYPYVEGFSAGYAANVIAERGTGVRAIYDPFGGAGTTLVEASVRRIPSFYCEVNPFMAFVANTKVNAVQRLAKSRDALCNTTNRYIENLHTTSFNNLAEKVSLREYEAAFPGRDYFEETHIRNLLAAREAIANFTEDPSLADLVLFAIASIAVDSSNMTRRADLRRRRDDEYKNRIVDVPAMLTVKLASMVEDILSIEDDLSATRMAATDARFLPAEFNNSFDLVISSPPYLNGTNYFRNTKIELWITGLIQQEGDLSKYTPQAVASGINNISKRRKDKPDGSLPAKIEAVIEALNEQAYDQRIPKLVTAYFEDMRRVLACTFNAMRTGAAFVLDIGDSKFAGVHVPTDEMLIDVAESIGFRLDSLTQLAKRYSRDKTELRQAELVFVKPKPKTSIALSSISVASNEEGNSNDRAIIAQRFQQELPYRTAPYSSRAWGHTLHSLCCYQGKLKPSFAHWLIREFTTPGMVVLDPLGGVGTIALEACLQGRVGITSDLSPFASVVGKAKVAPPPLKSVLERVAAFAVEIGHVHLDDEDYSASEFGLNAQVRDYYHEKTLIEVLQARKHFLNKSDLDQADCFIKASLLHILHGNRPYALSRISHPITPFNPSGIAEYRSLIERVHQRIERAYSDSLPDTFVHGTGYQADFRQLPSFGCPQADCIVTSPPFIGLRFDRPNWLRMWFCGWQERDFHKTSLNFLERQQSGKNLDVYKEFFAICDKLLKVNGFILLHIGGSEKYDMNTGLTECASPWFQLTATIRENVETIEKHGVRDKGTTTSHQVLVFERRNC